MKRFTILKNTFDEFHTVLDIFKALVGNRVEYFEKNGYIVLYYDYDNVEDIQNFFLSLGNEMMIDIIGYTTNFLASKQNEEEELAMELMPFLSSGMYSLKTALYQVECVPNKKRMLEFILDSTGIEEEFIKKFVLSDLNISKASQMMYIHRNTLNYKLDKLKELTGFDLRCFIDAFILYELVLRK